jgi:hypothetical protein
LGRRKGQIAGRVIDRASQQPLTGANIQLLGTQLGTLTGADGSFVIKAVAENIYKLQVSFIGYQTYIETDVRVVRNKSTYIEEIELSQGSIELNSVVVTSGFAEDDDEAPVSNFNYSREQIIRTPGSTGDIFRAIEALPGVSTSGGEFSAFSVRGGTPRENIILVDNIPFSKVTHFDGGNTEEQEAQGGRFSIFAPGTVEGANFQGGGFSAQYGGKYSSLLDLKISEGNLQTPTVDGRIDILGWEFNYNGPSYLHDKTSLFVSARRQDFDRILKLTNQEDAGSPAFTDLFVKTATVLNPRHKLSLLAIYAPESYERSTKHVLNSQNFTDDFRGTFDEELALLGLNWRFLTGQNSYWQNTFFFGNRDSKGTVGQAIPIFTDGQPPQSENDFRAKSIFAINENQAEVGTRSIFTYLPSAASALILGFELSRKDFDYAITQNGLDTLYVFDPDDFRPDPDQKYIVRDPDQVNIVLNDAKVFAASFANYSFQPAPRLTLNLGLRHEFNQFNENHDFSPRGSLSYRLSEQTRLSLATGLYYQIPEFVDLAAASQNLKLRTERSVHLIGGLTHYLRHDLKFIMEGYYKSLDDLLVKPDRSNSLWTNQGDGWASGIDLALIRRFAEHFYGQINYSYSQSQRHDRDGRGAYDADFNQPHIFSTLAGYQFNKEWTIAAKWRYATGRPTDAFIVHKDVFTDFEFKRFPKEITANNAARLGNFHTL